MSAEVAQSDVSREVPTTVQVAGQFYVIIQRHYLHHRVHGMQCPSYVEQGYRIVIAVVVLDVIVAVIDAPATDVIAFVIHDDLVVLR